jgi:hypothetical protein
VIEAENTAAPGRIDSNGDADLGFQAMRDAFAEAKRLRPSSFRESPYILGGHPVRMQIAGRRFAEFMHTAFAHLSADDSDRSNGALTVELWDEAETSVSCRIGLNRDDLDLHPNLRKSADGRYASYQLQHSLVCLDIRSGLMVGYTSNAEELSLYERGRPLHVPLSLWHKSLNMPLVHAGLVSKNGRGLLLAGPGGSGKSTSAITSACAGFSYLSDDLIALQLSPDGSFIGHSLYNSTFLEPDHLNRFALFAPYAITGRYPFEKKRLVLLSEIASLRFERSCRIEAIILPRVLRAPACRLRPVSKGEALLTLAPSSLLVGERSNGAEGFDKLSRLVQQAPCYRLELSEALDEIPRVLAGVLSEAGNR